MILEKVKSSEKIVRMIEANNLIVFEVDRSVKKEEIKKEVEKVFNVKVDKVNVQIRKNKKLAYIKLKPEFKAIDLANKLGIM
jgi:large subunit ribosomal protein L23